MQAVNTIPTQLLVLWKVARFSLTLSDFVSKQTTTNYKQIKLDSDSRSRKLSKIFFDGAKYYKKLKMSELNYESVSKMKVAELRSALEDHGLDSKGTKPILVARLQSYMENQPSQNAEPGNNL